MHTFMVLLCASITPTHTIGGVIGGVSKVEAATAQEALHVAANTPKLAKHFEVTGEVAGRLNIRHKTEKWEGWLSTSMPRPRDA